MLRISVLVLFTSQQTLINKLIPPSTWQPCRDCQDSNARAWFHAPFTPHSFSLAGGGYNVRSLCLLVLLLLLCSAEAWGMGKQVWWAACLGPRSGRLARGSLILSGAAPFAAEAGAQSFSYMSFNCADSERTSLRRGWRVSSPPPPQRTAGARTGG